MSTKKLTRRQARWSLELSEYTFTITHRPGSLTEEPIHFQGERIIFWTAIKAIFLRVIDPENVFDLQCCYGGSRSSCMVHSTVLDKVFVQEADWPLIIADFLAGEDNVWIEEISEDWLKLCKRS
ncbi:hypothetical protein BASA83_004628 [Batrachochytrium salamandrivorans]|nr:hypothetical protein BASA83_004628 [Batrachochytrium salamandrivorans]